MLVAQLSEAQIDRDSRNQMPPLSLERSEDAQDHVRPKLLAGRMGGPAIERRWSRRAAGPQPEKSFAYDGHRISQNSIGEVPRSLDRRMRQRQAADAMPILDCFQSLRAIFSPSWSRADGPHCHDPRASSRSGP